MTVGLDPQNAPLEGESHQKLVLPPRGGVDNRLLHDAIPGFVVLDLAVD
jgi:hypothetical protein